MNTKLNMGVIEDKSITYSKLADDVAESITATMTGSTPDWNAKEGEAGYIENKPFERKNIEPSISNNEVVYQGNIDTKDIYIQCYDSIYSFPFGYNDDGFFIETEKEIYIPEESVSIKVRRYEYETRVQSLNSELDINDIPSLITVFYVNRKLNQSDIDNTVIKTTPQTLSDTDKNQVKENLGISNPDWNAQEGEAGYIENRTHYSDIERQQLPSNVENYEINFGGAAGRDVILNFYFRSNFITEGVKFDDVSEHIISRAGATIKIKRKNIGDTGFYITTSSSFSDNEYIESVYVTKQLSDYYIPDTIARKSEFTTINGQSITEGGNIDLVADGDEVSSLTLKPGCKIGSFSVDSDNNLSSHDVEHIVISNNSISISSDDYVDFTTIKDGRLQIVSEREDMPAMSIAGPNGIEIADPLRNQFDGYAIRAYDGMFGGLRPWVRVINGSSSSSDKTLTALDHTILIYASSQQTITLPTDPKDGQEYDILMALKDSTSVKHVVSSNSANIFVPKEGNLKSSLTVDAHGCIKLIYVKNTGYWWYYRMV